MGLGIPVPVATLVTLLPLAKGQRGQQHHPVPAAWLGSMGLLLWRWCCAGKVLPGTTEAGHDGSQRTQQTQIVPFSCPLPSRRPLHKRRSNWLFPTDSSHALYELNKPVTLEHVVLAGTAGLSPGSPLERLFPKSGGLWGGQGQLGGRRAGEQLCQGRQC